MVGSVETPLQLRRARVPRCNGPADSSAGVLAQPFSVARGAVAVTDMHGGSITRDLLLWAARRTIAQHADPVDGLYMDPCYPRCRWCASDGCRMLAWAEGVLRSEHVAAATPGPASDRHRPALLARSCVGRSQGAGCPGPVDRLSPC